MSGASDSGQAKGTNGVPQGTFDNLELENKEKDLEKKLDKDIKIDLSDKTLDIEDGKQDKHIKGTNNFRPGSSEITISKTELQDLVKSKAGTGNKVNKNKERVNFGKIIGVYVDGDTGERKPTTVGLINYSKKGVHVVPARPSKEK